MKRTDYCGRIDRRYLEQTVSVMGWVHRRRDHGGVIFIDLRDREGIVQVVCDPDRAETFAIAEKLRNEYCIAVSGRVRPRPEGTVNANLASGYGYTGILVAFLARHNPLGIIPMAILLGGISAAGGLLQRRMGLPDATVVVLQGMIFLSILTSETIYGRLRWFQPREAK